MPVVSRSVGNPIFVGLGTAALLALTAGFPVALAVTEATPPSGPTPSPIPPRSAPSSAESPSTVTTTPSTPPPPKPVLHVIFELPNAAVHGGDSVTAKVYVYATPGKATHTKLDVHATANAGVASQPNLGTVTEDHKSSSITVFVPKNMTKGNIIVTAVVSSPDAEKSATKADTLTVTKKPAPKPSHTTTPSGSGTSGGSTGTTGTSGGTGSVTSGSAGTPPYVPPSPAAALQTPQTPQVSLPEITAATPSTAPTVPAAAPSNTLRSGGSPNAQELTFQRLASTQTAWLAALLVAFAVLLAQLRIRGPHAGHVRPKGDHRRSRHGLFQR
ncbi:MAG: hypothetical protein JWO67_2550 [Streptosporangiaceae bacterium]|nr:hypothetical protein [Streptosporangiaceae bacterium]